MPELDPPNGVPLTRRQMRERQNAQAQGDSAPEQRNPPQRAAAPTGGSAAGGVTGSQPPAREVPTREVPATTGTIGGLSDLNLEEPSPRKKRRGGGCLISLAVILVILGGLTWGAYWAINEYGGRVADALGLNQEPTDYEEGEATGEAIIVIREGDTGYEISLALHEEGVTLTPTAFYDMLVSAQSNPDFHPGTYTLQEKMTSQAALAALEDPENRVEGVAFPEGYTVENVIPILVDRLDVSEEDVAAALENPADYGVDADSLEGWLFPASYAFEPGTTAAEAVQVMVDRMTESLDAAGAPDDAASRQEILTIASIIQREARYSEDFYKVSRVILNRLDGVGEGTGMLQMDSTAQYGYGEMHAGTASSSQEALDDDNPWNTYQHEGLPAGPIANPGDLAIDAAIHPADGPWLYFVTVNLATGETVFSTTNAEHEVARAEWQNWCQENPDQGC